MLTGPRGDKDRHRFPGEERWGRWEGSPWSLGGTVILAPQDSVGCVCSHRSRDVKLVSRRDGKAYTLKLNLSEMQRNTGSQCRTSNSGAWSFRFPNAPLNPQAF